jgi:hypothetical protein
VIKFSDLWGAEEGKKPFVEVVKMEGGAVVLADLVALGRPWSWWRPCSLRSSCSYFGGNLAWCCS